MNHLIFLKENNKEHEFVSHPWFVLAWCVFLGLMSSHVFLPCPFLVFFIHEFNHFKECEKNTFTSESHILLYFDRYFCLLNNDNNEGNVMELAKK